MKENIKRIEEVFNSWSKKMDSLYPNLNERHDAASWNENPATWMNEFNQDVFNAWCAYDIQSIFSRELIEKFLEKLKFLFLQFVGDEKEYFGEDFLYEDFVYPNQKKVKIASIITEYEKTKIDVYTECFPAQTFTFVIDNKFDLETGSGDWNMYKNIFEHLKADMLGVKKCKKDI